MSGNDALNHSPDAPDLLGLYTRLFEAHGPQHWWPAETRFEVMVGAILTQNTAWTNVEKAIANLKQANALTPDALRTVPLDELAHLIRPSGYFNVKAKKLRALGAYVGRYGDDLDALFSAKPLADLREEVLALYGVGPETADSMLLYAGGLPVFVIDAYTVRILARLGVLEGNARYADAQALFHEALPADVPLFNEFHALFVIHGKDVCRSRGPRCTSCPLVDICVTGRRSAASAG